MRLKVRFKWRILFVSAVFLAVAIVITLSGIGVKNENPAPLVEKYVENPELIAADVYAEHFGVTEEEAIQRFSISDDFSGMDTLLEASEPETFGGLWIQHEPSFCVAIAFTRNGEEAIKKYISENLTQYVQLRMVKYSLRELKDTQLKVGAALRDLGVLFDSSSYVQENIVEFRVTDRTEIDKAIEEGKLALPDCVRIVVVGGLATPE